MSRSTYILLIRTYDCYYATIHVTTNKSLWSLWHYKQQFVVVIEFGFYATKIRSTNIYSEATNDGNSKHSLAIRYVKYHMSLSRESNQSLMTPYW